MILLHWADYFVFSCFILTSLLIGVYVACTAKRGHSTGEFISGGGSMPLIPTMLSLVVSYISAIIILGMTAEISLFGIQSWVFHFAAFSMACILSERILVPWIYKMNITSIYEYLYLRYHSRAVHLVGVICGLTYMVIYMGSCLYATALALESATALDVTITMTVMALVCTVYTAMGGMKAVVYTDVLQALIILAGVLAVIIKGYLLVGGPGYAFKTANENGRLQWYQLNFDPRERHTVWGFMFGITFTWTMVFGLSQPAVQRYCMLANVKKARQVLLLCAVVLCLVNTLVGISGIAVFAYNTMIRCDPLQAGIIQSPNQLLSHFVVTVFKTYPGVIGLFMAALMSGAMSSMSSSLSSAAAVAWSDIVKVYRPSTTDLQATIVNKILVVIFSTLAIAVAFLAASVPSLPVLQTSFSFVSIVCGPMGGIFLMGGLFRKANSKGALIGCITGAMFVIWITIGSLSIKVPTHPLPPTPIDQCLNYNTTNILNTNINNVINSTSPVEALKHELSRLQQLYTISYTWYSFIGCLICMLVGLPISYCTFKQSDEDHHQEYMFISLQDVLRLPWAAEPLHNTRTNAHKQYETNLLKPKDTNHNVIYKTSQEEKQSLTQYKETDRL